MPNILANGEPNGQAIDIDNTGFSSGCKVALLVKHLIVRQALFIILGEQFSARDDAGTVEQCTILSSGVTHHHCHVGGQFSAQRRQRGLGAIQQITTQKQIFGWVPSQCQLRKYHHLRTRCLLGCTHLKHALGVAGDIANQRIDLRHAEFHLGILSHTGRAETGGRRVPYFPPVGWRRYPWFLGTECPATEQCRAWSG